MKRTLCLLAICALTAPAWGQPKKPDEFDAMGHEPPMLGAHMARGEAHSGGARSSPNVTYHNGDIMPSATAAVIFWGTSWNSNAGDKITGLDLWYQGVGGSTFARTSDEYTGLNSDKVSGAISYLGHYIDATAAPSKAPATSTILGEVCKVIPAAQLTANGYYAVYVDTPRGHASYCAWHSWGSCGKVPVQFSFFFKLDGDAGCDPGDNMTLSGHSQGLAAVANVSGHELSEARTDPRGLGWFDQSGDETSDKCAWTFGGTLLTFQNGSQWKIQGNWSNTAYSTGVGGYPNSSNQRGCIDGSLTYPPVAP